MAIIFGGRGFVRGIVVFGESVFCFLRGGSECDVDEDSGTGFDELFFCCTCLSTQSLLSLTHL